MRALLHVPEDSQLKRYSDMGSNSEKMSIAQAFYTQQGKHSISGGKGQGCFFAAGRKNPPKRKKEL
jgi:hypothetical protein